ncbi:MAG: hypothetical protein Q8Q48_02595 [Candidatus Staskawiczbacteria bacterium]|nr:hypothetical protein [Candidatus Staskawiczbacteria bacterium]
MDFWHSIYNFLGITDFIYFISSPELQDMLFPVKLIFVSFAMFFLAFVVYFMLNSSWLQYKFLEDVTEFFSWQAYGTREIAKQWNRIKKRAESGAEADYKLAIIDAEDFFMETLEKAGYEGKDFDESVAMSGRLLATTADELKLAHETRNSIVYDPDFRLSDDHAKRVLSTFESAINAVGLS